ncbi:MAG: pilin [Patescibacteria group bacterium]
MASFCDQGPGSGSPNEFCTRLQGQSFPVVNGIATVTSSYDYSVGVTNVYFSAKISGKLRANPNGSPEVNLGEVIVTKKINESSITSSPEGFTVSGFNSSQPTTPPGGGGTTPPAGGGTTPPAGGGGGGGGSGAVPAITPSQPAISIPDINTFVSKLYSFGISIAGVVFVIMFLIGGLQYLTTAGNEESTGKAKKLMVDAIIGLVLVLAAYAIAKFIGVELGIF